MTNDDAKYREWWEKLRAEMLETKDDTDAHALIASGIILRRMLQIEAGK